MPSDNTLLNAGSGGETFPSLADASNINWPVGCSAYPTVISPGANVLQLVDLTHGLPIQPMTGATFAVSAVSLPLPTGAATAANQATEIASLASIDGKITSCNTGAVVLAAGTAVIGHVVIDSGTISLPTGASTAANQATGNTSLNSIDSKTPSLGQALAAASVPVVLTAAQLTTLTPPVTQNVNVAQVSGVTASVNTGNADTGTQRVVLASNQPAVNTTETNLDGSIVASSGTSAPSKGLNVLVKTNDGTPQYQPVPGGAGGRSVIIEGISGGTGVPITAASLPLPTGAATETTLATLSSHVTACNTGAVTISAALPAGTNVLGHIITDAGSVTTATLAAETTKVIGTVNQGTSPWVVSGSFTASNADPVATTGTISAVDIASTSTTNSQGQTIVTGAPTANSSVSVTVSAHSGVTVQLTGTAITNLNFSTERSVDGGTTWTPFAMEVVGKFISNSAFAITDNNATILRGNAGEMSQVRVRCTNKTGTSVAVRFQPGFGVSNIIANQGPATDITAPWITSLVAQTSGGTTIYRNFQTSAAVIAASVKNSGGQVYALECFNINATPVFVRLYNITTTPGTGDTVFWSGIIPGNTAGAGFVKSWPQGMTFGTGIGIRVTNAIADADNTALAANTVMVNVEYK